MRLLLLAGGRNERLGPLRGSMYKPFLRLQDASTVGRIVVRAIHLGVVDVTIATDGSDPIVDYFVREIAEERQASISHLIVEGPNETKIRRWHESLDVNRAYPLLVCVADTLARVDFRQMIDRCRHEGYDSTIAVVPAQLDVGLVETDRSGQVTGFYEKRLFRDALINSGYMALGETAFRYLSEGSSLVSTLTKLADSGQLAAVTGAGPLLHADSLSDISIVYREATGHVDSGE